MIDNALVPKLGIISRRDKEGLKGRSLIIWSACPDCGTERWVPRNRPKQLCRKCSGVRRAKETTIWRSNGEHRSDCKCTSCQPMDQWGSKNPSWSGGHTTKAGYAAVLLSQDDPFWEMAGQDRYVLEHRLVMAQALGRPLKEGETVHHINSNRFDNRIENLELWYTNHGHGVRVQDLLGDWARLYGYHCPGCKGDGCYDNRTD